MLWKTTVLLWAGILTATFALAAGRDVPKTVDEVDLSRYLGRWYEIARYPNRFQNFCAGDVTATYERAKGDRLKVINECRTSEGDIKRADGAAKIVENSGGARLKVRFAPRFLSFLPFVWADYWILDLDAGYQWAVVGTPDRKYLWILSRQPTLDSIVYDGLLERVREQGFDPGRLVRTRQDGTRDRAGS